MDLHSIGALPVGFAMRLAEDLTAMEQFSQLSEGEKEQMVAYIQGGTTGEEAEQRVRESIERLYNGIKQNCYSLCVAHAKNVDYNGLKNWET